MTTVKLEDELVRTPAAIKLKGTSERTYRHGSEKRDACQPVLRGKKQKLKLYVLL